MLRQVVFLVRGLFFFFFWYLSMTIYVNLIHCFWLQNAIPANKYAISYVLASHPDPQLSLHLGHLQRGVWVMQAGRHLPETRFLSIAFSKSLILQLWDVFSSSARIETPGQVPSPPISCLFDGIPLKSKQKPQAKAQRHLGAWCAFKTTHNQV